MPTRGPAGTDLLDRRVVLCGTCMLFSMADNHYKSEFRQVDFSCTGWLEIYTDGLYFADDCDDESS